MQLNNKVYPALYIVICPFIICYFTPTQIFALEEICENSFGYVTVYANTGDRHYEHCADSGPITHALMHFNSTYSNNCLHTCRCFNESANEWIAFCSAVRTVVRFCKACRANTITWPLQTSFATVRISEMRVCSRKDFMGSRRLKLPRYISNEMSVHPLNGNNCGKP